MIFKSEILTQVAGSIGGVTYSHGRSGLERKARIHRPNKATSRQMAARGIFTELNIAWKSELTEEQRTGWKNYAAGTPLLGVLGDRLLISGHAMYGRCNAVRMAGGITRVDEAPRRPGLTTLGNIGVLGSKSADRFLVLTSEPQEWRDNDGGILVIQSTQLITLSRTRNARGFRNMGSLLGNTASPPPGAFFDENGFGQSPGIYDVGTPAKYRLVASDSEGRLSSPVEIIFSTVP